MQFGKSSTSLRHPGKVYELSSYRKRTKNQWARDDPAFAVLLVALIAFSTIAYGIAFELDGPLDYLALMSTVILPAHFSELFVGLWSLVASKQASADACRCAQHRAIC